MRKRRYARRIYSAAEMPVRANGNPEPIGYVLQQRDGYWMFRFAEDPDPCHYYSDYYDSPEYAAAALHAAVQAAALFARPGQSASERQAVRAACIPPTPPPPVPTEEAV